MQLSIWVVHVGPVYSAPPMWCVAQAHEYRVVLQKCHKKFQKRLKMAENDQNQPVWTQNLESLE